MKKLSVIAIAAAIALCSCATTKSLPAPELERLDVAAGYIARAAGETAGSDFARRGMLCLLGRIGEKRGPEAVRALADLRSPVDLERLLVTRYAITPYEEALDAFMAWDRASRAPRWDPKKAVRLETEHFALVTMPGTPAHEDRAKLADLLEGQLDSIEAILDPDPAMRARFAANMASLASKKVEVVLPPDSRAFPGFGDTAQTSWGFAMGEEGLGIVASINLPYYNPLSSAILAHEATHLLDIFYKLDLDSAPPIPRRDEDLASLPKKELEAFQGELQAWAKGVFAAIVPNDTAFGEGFAEYVAGKVNPLRRALIGSPNATLAAMSARTPLLGEVLAASPSVKDRRVRIVRYTELYSFVSYLIDRYGMDRFLAFYMKTPLAESNFEAAYGKGYGSMQGEWMAARGF